MNMSEECRKRSRKDKNQPVISKQKIEDGIKEINTKGNLVALKGDLSSPCL